MNGYYITSESVTEGHPDKICDQISDSILDAYLRLDENSHVAVEAMVSKNAVMIAGEVSSKGKVDHANIARDMIKKIGYTKPNKGFDDKSCMIFTNIHQQSADIAMGVLKSSGIGGGDQGIMYGYACAEAPGFMPMPFYLANQLVLRLAQLRKDGGVSWLGPDGKAQVTMKYDSFGLPRQISSIVLSAQHEDMDIHEIRRELKTLVIDPVIDPIWIKQDTKIHINPTGRFVIGGPAGDTGVTGRKIMVDTYGGAARHGGGAFSGKDGTKVDRCAAYMARYAAKNLVAAGLAKRCEVSVAYAIGQTEPETVSAQTFGTEQVPAGVIDRLLRDVFSFKVADILENLKLRQPIFENTAAYGHFGREETGFLWEATDQVQVLQSLASDYIK